MTRSRFTSELRGSGARASRSSSPLSTSRTGRSSSPRTKLSSSSTAPHAGRSRFLTSTASRSVSPDADDQLRSTVSELAGRDDCSWAGVFFVEGDELVLGPQAGEPEPGRRTAVPVVWRATRVAELAADGAIDPAHLEAVAAEIADLCLVGWDTSGEDWEP